MSIPVPAAGLPVGLQLAGRCGADMALLRAAAGIERILAGIREATPTGRPVGAVGEE